MPRYSPMEQPYFDATSGSGWGWFNFLTLLSFSLSLSLTVLKDHSSVLLRTLVLFNFIYDLSSEIFIEIKLRTKNLKFEKLSCNLKKYTYFRPIWTQKKGKGNPKNGIEKWQKKKESKCRENSRVREG